MSNDKNRILLNLGLLDATIVHEPFPPIEGKTQNHGHYRRQSDPNATLLERDHTGASFEAT